MRGNKREKEKGSHIQLRKSIKRKTARRLGISVKQLTWQSGILYRTDGGFERIVEEAKCVPGCHSPKPISAQKPGRQMSRYQYADW